MKIFKKIALFAAALSFSVVACAHSLAVETFVPFHVTLDKGDVVLNDSYTLTDPQTGSARVIDCAETGSFSTGTIDFLGQYLVNPAVHYLLYANSTRTFGAPNHSEDAINPVGSFTIQNNTDKEIDLVCNYRNVSSLSGTETKH